MKWLNKILKLCGVVVLDLDVVAEMLSMIVAYRVKLRDYLEPHEVMVWDSDAKTISVVSRH